MKNRSGRHEVRAFCQFPGLLEEEQPLGQVFTQKLVKVSLAEH